MGTNTSVYVGPYVLAKMAKQKRTEKQRACSKNKRHEVGSKDKFCPHCGSAVKTISVPIDEYKSFHDLMDKSDNVLTKEERFVLRKFMFMVPECLGLDDENVEVLLPENVISVSADQEGITNLTPGELRNIQAYPDPRDVMLLKNTIGYESVEVKFGVLVEVA